MDNLSSIARPYALAAFEAAKAAKQLPAWKTFLQTAALVADDEDMVRLLANPELSSASLLQLFEEVLSSELDQESKNFLRLLAQNKRFMVLPAISALFNDYYTTLEKISEVRLITAVPIDDIFRTKLSSALSKRLQQDVTLTCDVDPAILGGAVIHIGDKVIDGSIRGKLARLLEFSLR